MTEFPSDSKEDATPAVPSVTAYMDQLQTAMRVSVAPAVAAYAEALLAEGVEPGWALILTKDYQATVLHTLMIGRTA